LDTDYTGRVAVVTGGGRGFGKAFGAALAARGARVALIDRDAEALAEATAEIGPAAMGFEGDVTDEAAMNSIMAQVAERAGGIDILINNAGLHSTGFNRPLQELGLAKIRQLFDVNVLGVVITTFAAAPHMAGRTGANIVNIASASAFLPGGYGVSKLAVIGLTMTFARELSGIGVRVNAIAPGVILTDTIRQELPAEMLARVKAQQFVDCHGEEADVVNAMLYLTSPLARFVTAETLRVTGGFTPGV
jgi:3-oxoacyl-[acyl-carrier protein] reductase